MIRSVNSALEVCRGAQTVTTEVLRTVLQRQSTGVKDIRFCIIYHSFYSVTIFPRELIGQCAVILYVLISNLEPNQCYTTKEVNTGWFKLP